MNKNSYIKILISIIFTLIILYISHFIWLETDGVHTSFKFDIFFIILVLSFALFYKISKYIVEFKTVKNCSKADIFFLALFFIFLFIPMSHINQDKISKAENRTLAKWHSIIENNKINYQFGKNFENYFNDRYALRYRFIKSYNTSKIHIDKHYKTSKGYIGNEEYMFLFWRDETLNYYSDIEVKKIYKYIKSLINITNKKGIDLYVVIVPIQNDIYSEKRALYYPQKSKFYKIYDIFKYKEKFEIVYPREQFLKEKKNHQMFYKQDVHYTDYGALVSYNELIKQMQKKYKDLYPISENDMKIAYSDRQNTFHDGGEHDTIWQLLQLTKKDYPPHTYKYYYLDDNKNIKSDNNEERKIYYNPNGYNKNVMLLGNSFIEAQNFLFASTFKKTVSIRTNPSKMPRKQHYNLNRFVKLLDNYKPDILVFLIDESLLMHIANTVKVKE